MLCDVEAYFFFFGLLSLLFVLSQTLTRQLSFLLYHLSGNQQIVSVIIAVIFFPGVVLHELSHFLTAVLLGVHAQHMEFFPKIIDGRLKLGSVQIEKTDPVRKTLIGIAPLFYGVGFLLFLAYLFQSYFAGDIIAAVIIGALYYQVSNTMFSSKKDLEGTWIVLLSIIVFFIILWFFDVPVTSFLLTSSVGVLIQEILEKGSFYLAAAVGIDVCAVLLLFGVKKIR